MAEPAEEPNNFPNIDINNPDFYDKVQTEIEYDMAQMKKNIEVILTLRLEAAEIEVETAALYHAELWYELLDLQINSSQENSGDEDYDEESDITQTT